MRNPTVLYGISIAGIIVLVLILFGNIFEQTLLENKLEKYFSEARDKEPCRKFSDGDHLHNFFQSIPKNGDSSPSFEEIYAEFLANRSRLPDSHRHKEEKIADEYEPFIYTDDVKLQYRFEGLKNLSVGDEGTFTLNTSGAVRPRSRIEFVRVLFYGIAIRAPQTWVGDADGVWTARFSISDPGLYRVYVESVLRLSRTEHFYRSVVGSPFILLVRPAESEHTTDEDILARMPVKEAVAGALPIVGSIRYPPMRCTDARWRPGRWVRCHHTPEPCVRSGWVWVPDECHFRVFTGGDLLSLPRPLWIVFAGTSVQRGTFLSALDMLTQAGGANANLTSNRVWRCWGWMDAAVGPLRVSYLDLRFSHLWMTGESPYVEPMYTAHAIQALRALGAMDGRGPDIFYLEAGDWGLGIHEPYLVKTWLGLDWPGRFVMHIVKPCPAADFCGDRLALAGAGALPPPYAWVEAHPAAGIEYADESHLTYGLLNDQVARLTPIHAAVFRVESD